MTEELVLNALLALGIIVTVICIGEVGTTLFAWYMDRQHQKEHHER